MLRLNKINKNTKLKHNNNKFIRTMKIDIQAFEGTVYTIINIGTFSI